MGLRAIWIVSLSVALTFILSNNVWGAGAGRDGKIGDIHDRLQLPRGFLSYQDFTSPLSYPSLTRRDVNPLDQTNEVVEVEGKSATIKIVLPIGLLFGLSPTTGFSFDLNDRGVQEAIADAKRRHGVQILYDVRIDMHLFSIFGLYSKTTTIVHAKGIRGDASK